MSINKVVNNLWSAVQAPFLRRWQSAQQVDQIDQSIGNAYDYTAWDNAFANEYRLLEYDSDNQLRLGDAVNNPLRGSATTIHLYPNANMVTQTFFTNPTPRAVVISGLNAVFTTAGSVAGAACKITHETAVNGLGTVQQAAG